MIPDSPISRPWRFDPWLAVDENHYRGLRLLLVGESHYDPQPELLPRSHTQDVVRDYGLGDHHCTTKLFKNAYRAFSGDFDLANLEAKRNFWSSICYCNYFQRAMETPGEMPTEVDCQKSAAPFDEILRHVRPDAIVVMSRRLWVDYIETPCVRLPSIGPLNANDIFRFEIGNGEGAPAMHIGHPSPRGSFSAQKWHPYLLEFIAFCLSQRSTKVG